MGWTTISFWTRPATSRCASLLAITLAFAAPMAQAAETSGLPLPRFVSLRSDEVNLRTGPGVRYPVDWIYLRKDLPVEVVAEYDTWRKIRDWQGTDGWVHQSMLSGRRMMVVTGGLRTLFRADAIDSPPAAQVEAGVVGRLLQCPRGKALCRVELSGLQGWMRREEFWGVYNGEFLE
ncbi:MAG: hypothetical protein HQL41_04030 [Alphaproteobacteria bacterium]|nr:hypothetical protein [Alphaproteobacteria bacterium]